MKWLWIMYMILIQISTLYGKTTVCLNMIVKNESHVITRVLQSVKPLIDYWVIVDTGSVDGTQELIRSYLQGIPGELYERPWKNFGYNRTEALELAKGKGDYLVFLDADDWLEYDLSFQLPSLEKDAYYIFAGDKAETFSYLKMSFVKNSLPWRWEGVMHEYVTCDWVKDSAQLQGLRYVLGGNGARSKNPQKYHVAAQVLEEALLLEPGNVRYWFYLAESCRDAGLIQKAITIYEKRVEMGGWEEEVFWSLFQIAQLKQKEGYKTEEVIQAYYKAHCYRPHRAEPVYYLAEIYNRAGQYQLAYECLKGWNFTPKPEGKDTLFCLDWIENYGLLFQLSICSYYVKNYQESLEVNNTLLKLPSLPQDIRDQVKQNREFSLQKLL